MPSRFKCGRLFAELGARSPESWDEYMSGAPCSCFVLLAFLRRLLLQHRSPSFSRCACLAVVSVLLTTLALLHFVSGLETFSPAASLFTPKTCCARLGSNVQLLIPVPPVTNSLPAIVARAYSALYYTTPFPPTRTIIRSLSLSLSIGSGSNL